MSLFPDLHVAPFDASAFAEDERRNLLRLFDVLGPMSALDCCARYRRAHGEHIDGRTILMRLLECVESGDLTSIGEPPIFSRKDR